MAIRSSRALAVGLGVSNLAVVAAAIVVAAVGAADPTPVAQLRVQPVAAPPSTPSGRATPSKKAPAPDNGELVKPPATILKDAYAALNRQRSFQLDISGTDEGTTGTITEVIVPNVGLHATLDTTDGHIDVIDIDGTAYLNGDAKALGADVKSLGGRYVSLPDDGPDGEKLGHALVGYLAGLFEQDPKRLEVTTAVRGGRPVVVLSRADGVSLTLSGTGEPLPLSATAATGDNSTVTFSHFGAAVTLVAPTGSLRYPG